MTHVDIVDLARSEHRDLRHVHDRAGHEDLRKARFPRRAGTIGTMNARSRPLLRASLPNPPYAILSRVPQTAPTTPDTDAPIGPKRNDGSDKALLVDAADQHAQVVEVVGDAGEPDAAVLATQGCQGVWGEGVSQRPDGPRTSRRSAC